MSTLQRIVGGAPIVPGERLLKKNEVIDKTGISDTTLYRYIKAGKFPKPLKFGEHFSRWRLSEVEDWINSLSKN